MGVALPQGDIKTVYETISTDNYMGWKSCTMQEAQQATDKGTPAIGISEDKIVVLSAKDEEQPVAQTTSVMTLDENTAAYAVEGMRYYTYAINTCVVSPKITSSYLFGQAFNIPYPASSGYTGNAFTVNFAGKSITVNNPATNLISTYGDLSAVKSNLIAGKCVMLCLVTERGMHYVLADGLCVATSDLDSIKVADPADGKRKTLREAIDRATTGSPSASYVRTAYPLY